MSDGIRGEYDAGEAQVVGKRPFQVIPAIDLKDGKCVRLFQGDYEQVTTFNEDPVEVARQWEQQGATIMHIVDLDAAASGSFTNLATIAKIVQAVQVPIQVGGGVRNWEALQQLFGAGAHRAIIGTAALKNPAFVSQAAAAYPDRVLVSLDAKAGLVATDGWRETSPRRALDLAREVIQRGIRGLIYTDISRDGTLSEPNYAAFGQLLGAVTVPVIASGGVADLAHLRELKRIGAAGAIVGRALYTGAVDLAVAIRELEHV